MARTRSAANWSNYALIGFAAVMMAATAMYAVTTLRRLESSVLSTLHTQTVLSRVSDIEATLGTAEAAQRDYLLLASDASLEAYRKHGDELIWVLASLEELVAEDAAQLERVRELRQLVAERAAIADETIDKRNRLGLEAAVETLRLRGLRASARALALVRAMREDEQQYLVARESAMQSLIRRTGTTLVAADLFALIAGVLGVMMLHRTRGARERQEIAEREASKAWRASHEKSAFLANMSHEIRTPMNAVLGFSQLLAERVKGEKEQQYLRAITSSGQALLALINDILDLSKIEAGKLDLRPIPTDLRELIDASLLMFMQMAADKRLSLRADVAPEIPAAVVLDGIRLRQVLYNLIGNAVKYTDNGGVVVRVELVESHGETEQVSVRLAVEDTGTGIASDQLERIFEPFVQASERASGKTGTGLGLSIARRVVELMGGSIAVASEVGRGSTFSVVLPDVPLSAEKPSRGTVGEPPNMDRLVPSRLLVVDDIALNRELLAAIFAGTHHTVLVASGGIEAVAMTRRHHPDVVLMDIRMPVVDGREARARIRADRSLDSVKVVAVTASSLMGDEVVLREQFDGYVRKPFTREELFNELARHIRRVDGADAMEATDATPDELAEAAPDDAREAVAARLAELYVRGWPELRDSLAMRDAHTFADELVALGKRAAAPALIAYGRRLRAAIQTFDVTTVESLLHQFPQHVRAAGLHDSPDASPGIAGDRDAIARGVPTM